MFVCCCCCCSFPITIILKINNFITSKNEFFEPHKATEDSDPSWFGYAITVKENKFFDRNKLVNFLNENRVSTRLMFGGNLIKQPAYEGKNFKIHGDLNNANIVMNSTFWIGVYPGITNEMIEYIFETFNKFLDLHCK